jgi:type II secretory pathway pseudopilin PulG
MWQSLHCSQSPARPASRNRSRFGPIALARGVERVLHFLRGMATRTTFFKSERGFSLLEAVIAAGMVAGAFAALAQVLAMSIANNVSTRSGSAAMVLAVQKLEQLRALPWDALSTGGTPGGDIDYLDLAGSVLAEGGARPPGTVYVRQWSVRPAAGSAEGLALQVRVTGGHNDARLVTIRTRRAP